MILNIRKSIFAVIFVVCGMLFGQGISQRESGLGGMVQRERTGGEVVFFEVHYVLSNDDSHNVEATYRLRQDFFTFTKTPNGSDGMYTAAAEAAIEILDSAGNSVTRQIKVMQLESATNVVTDLRKKFSQGKMTLRVPSGKYSVLFTVEDKESKRIFPDIRRQLTVPSKQQPAYSTLIPVMSEQNEPSYRSFNLSGDVEFSKDFGFLLVSNITGLANVKYSIKKLSNDDEERITITDTSVSCKAYPSSTVAAIETDGNINFTIEPAVNTTVYFIPVHGAFLKQGRYEFSATFSDSLKAKTIFATRWIEMPYSLNDLDLAIYPLQHLLTKDAYSELNSGSRAKRIEKFEQFWKQKDPTPETAYNEMMAEFYRRVDYAITAFRTLKETNGSLTDRGKIYILYGKPTSTERILEPGSSPKEIWKYESLKKTFIFEDRSKQGNYRLAESK